MSTGNLVQQIENEGQRRRALLALTRRLGSHPATKKRLRFTYLGKKRSAYLIKIEKTFANDRHSFLHILLRNDERRSETHAKNIKQKGRSEIGARNNKAKRGHKHINVRRLRQNTSALQQQTKLPCCPSFDTLLFIDDHRI